MIQRDADPSYKVIEIPASSPGDIGQEPGYSLDKHLVWKDKLPFNLKKPPAKPGSDIWCDWLGQERKGEDVQG